MTYLDQDVSEEDIPNDGIPPRYVEKDGRSFKIKVVNHHGHWGVYHAKNNIPVAALPGTYTNVDAAIKAVMCLPEDRLPPRQVMKQVLTPKVKKEEQE